MPTLKADNNFLLPNDISQIVVGISLLTQGLKSSIGSTLNTIAFNILSLLLFPFIIISWFFAFYLKKKVSPIYSLNYNQVNAQDYQTIIKTIKEISPHYKTFKHLSNLNYKPILPILVWGVAKQSQDILKAFCFYVESYIKFSYNLDFSAPKDDLFKHITSSELLKRRNKQYDYLI